MADTDIPEGVERFDPEDENPDRLRVARIFIAEPVDREQNSFRVEYGPGNLVVGFEAHMGGSNADDSPELLNIVGECVAKAVNLRRVIKANEGAKKLVEQTRSSIFCARSLEEGVVGGLPGEEDSFSTSFLRARRKIEKLLGNIFDDDCGFDKFDKEARNEFDRLVEKLKGHGVKQVIDNEMNDMFLIQ